MSDTGALKADSRKSLESKMKQFLSLSLSLCPSLSPLSLFLPLSIHSPNDPPPLPIIKKRKYFTAYFEELQRGYGAKGLLRKLFFFENAFLEAAQMQNSDTSEYQSNTDVHIRFQLFRG